MNPYFVQYDHRPRGREWVYQRQEFVGDEGIESHGVERALVNLVCEIAIGGISAIAPTV